MGFACWGQLGQPWQPLLIERLAPQRSNATRCYDSAVSGESFGEAEPFGGAKEPPRPASIILVSYMPLAHAGVAGENRSLVHPCRRAPLEAKRTGALLQQRLRKRAITLRRGRSKHHY